MGERERKRGRERKRERERNILLLFSLAILRQQTQHVFINLYWYISIYLHLYIKEYNLRLPPSDKRKCMEKIQDKTLTASAWIWQSHRATTIWQSLVVSWDSAGALWVSGNDASAPKPCLNPESSSDEGFVRSNTVV